MMPVENYLENYRQWLVKVTYWRHGKSKSLKGDSIFMGPNPGDMSMTMIKLGLS